MTYTPQPGDPWADYDGDLLTVAPIAEQGDAWWSSKAMTAVKQLASLGEPFTIYAITQEPYGVEEPPHANYFGSITAAAKAAGIIKAFGYLPSPRPSRNGGICRSWIGAVA